MADDSVDEVPQAIIGGKKKKKKPVGEEGAAAAGEGLTESMAELAVGDDEFAGLKKKKAPKKADGAGAAPAGGAGEAATDSAPPPPADDDDGLGLGLKKKKKKKVRMEEFEDAGDGGGAGPEGGEASAETGERGGGDANGGGAGAAGPSAPPPGPSNPWDGTTRDYTYEELLSRVFGILRQGDPELARQKQRTVLQPPQVLREGTKKTVFVNFTELCKTLHRAPEHVMGYLLAELGTTGSLDGQQRLIVKGRFVPKVFEGIFRRYVNEYVICSMCKASDTLLTKEQRLLILRCQNCGASRSVTTVKQGFVARVGRRKAEEK